MYRAARKSDALLTGAPLPTLFYFALPIILGNIFQQLYSIVDAIVVGKFLGDLPLAGISVAAPIVDVANALVIGGTIGIGVLCAQMCGAEDWVRLRCMNATALLGGAALTLVIAAVGIVCSVPLLRAQGTEEAVCREAAVYLQLVFAGLICCFLYNYYASMLRSCGNSRPPRSSARPRSPRCSTCCLSACLPGASAAWRALRCCARRFRRRGAFCTPSGAARR